ncbi:MAG: ParB N-terminal domain-containing protein [Clostridia bacterium]|nr:ParB N-terminal domain-containing protein [Clostridia bacterium]
MSEQDQGGKAPDMEKIEVVMVDVDKVRPWENNARIHTKRNLDELKKSLGRWKQTKPILVQKSTMRIIAGNGTYMAVVAMGYKLINCHIMDIDDTEAEALAIADNRTGLLSQWDDKILTGSLKHLQEKGFLDLTGYDSLELDKMISFQDGGMFEKLDPEKPKPKPDPKPAEEKPQPAEKKEEDPFDVPPSGVKDDAPYDQQISFTLDGFTYTLANPQLIKELHELTQYLKDAKKQEKEEVNDMVFEAILDTLYKKFMGGDDE